MPAVADSPKPRRRAAALFALGCALLAGVAMLASSAIGSNAKLVGKTKHSPKANCPEDCTVLGSVTGFVSRTDKRKQPFRIRDNGRLVAWSTRISRPSKDQKNDFGHLFESKKYGRKATARISVLKKEDKNHFKLKAQSPVVKLNSYFGRTQIFTLDDPIPVKKGWILAYTTMSWSPNLALAKRAPHSKWRASRGKNHCGSDEATKARPQKKLGQIRQYGCSFNDRILYWGYLDAN
jgi:hypothetical protein